MILKNTRKNAMIKPRGFFPVFLIQFTLLFSLLLAVAAYPVFGEWRSGPMGKVFINLPAGWKVHEVRQDKVSATNNAEETFFILRYYDGGRFDEVSALDDFVRGEIGADAQEASVFDFSGRDAAYGKAEFLRDGGRYEGYVLSIEGAEIDLSAVGFTSAKGFDAYEDMIVSVLDSISLGHSGIVQPGPVSRYRSPYPAERSELYSFSFEGQEVPVVMGRREMDASQNLIEREARLLSLYAGSEYAEEAWKRYYRILYRDLYARTAPIYSALHQHVFEGDESSRKIAERLLAWVQSFEYRRLQTMSDCLSPLKGAVTMVGDCDSRVLLYVMLLHYFDIEAVMMVSSVYSHGLAAVDVEGEGARFSVGGKKYLVAETTDDVEIGLIDREMSNTNAWIGIDFMQFYGSAVTP